MEPRLGYRFEIDEAEARALLKLKVQTVMFGAKLTMALFGTLALASAVMALWMHFK